MGKLYFFLLLFFIHGSASGQYSLTVANYSQDFDGLGTGNSNPAGGNLNLVNATLNGWYFSETGTNANTTITGDDGSSNTGDTYNYGTLLMSDRTLGGLQSNTLNPTYGFWFTNNTASGTITSLAITYTGEQWRLGVTGRFDGLNFQYSTDATSLTTGTWTDFDPLDCTAPTTTGISGSLNGNLAANQVAVTATILGLNITAGSTFFIRWRDADATGNDDGLGIDDFSFTAGYTPASTDYFRSITNGDWSLTTTWEQSPDSISWVAATSVPTSAANSITIRSGHTVTIATMASADQVFIKSGGTVDHFNGSFTISDGTGNDVNIENGGVFVLSSSISGPAFASGSATVNAATGATLRVSASGLTGAGTGVNASNYVYQHQSILEWTLGAGFSFSTDGVTYFPNVDAATIPIFRTTNATPIIVGATGATIINGIFQCDGATVNWRNSGSKTFRNGITGAGIVDGSGIPASGKFIINGATANLGGSGSLLLPAAGLDVGTGTTVTMITPGKTITGSVALLANSYVETGAFNLAVSGTITGGASNAYVRTNGTGLLTLNAVTTKTFPIGTATSYNPLIISNGAGLNYSAKVEAGINPVISFPTYGINRTWNITSSSVATNVGVTFQYAAADANAGALPQPQDMEILQNDGITWSISPGNSNITPGGADPAFTVATSSGLTIGTSPVPFALGIDGGFVLPLDCIITCNARKVNSSGIISWEINTCAEVTSFEVQRLINGGVFQTIAVIIPGIQLNYNYTDTRLSGGTHLYRIKVNRGSGATKYSNTVAILNGHEGLLITGLFPNPVIDQAMLIINAAKAGKVSFVILDLTGKQVKQWQATVAEGSNNIAMNTEGLSTGMYHLAAISDDSKTGIRFVKMQ